MIHEDFDDTIPFFILYNLFLALGGLIRFSGRWPAVFIDVHLDDLDLELVRGACRSRLSRSGRGRCCEIAVDVVKLPTLAC